MSRTKVVFMLAILLVSGCAATAQPRAAVTTEDFPPSEQVVSLVLPFDAYSPSLAALYTLSNARDRLTRDCMKALGLDWKLIARPMTVRDLRNRRRYGVIEMSIGQEYGYHVPAGLLTPAAVEQLYDARENSLSQHQKDAAYGEDGCVAKASRQLQGESNTSTDRLAQLDRRSLTDSQREAGVDAAMKSWRQCMSGLGQDYQDPLAAIADSRWWADKSAGPSTEEKEVAVADVRCKEQSGLIEVWRAAEVRIQQELIRQNDDYFRQLKAELERDLAEANAVLDK